MIARLGKMPGQFPADVRIVAVPRQPLTVPLDRGLVFLALPALQRFRLFAKDLLETR
jgi:hypothetical protein